MKKGLVLFLIAVMVMGLIVTACAPAETDANGQPVAPNSTPAPVGEEMTLVGQYRDVQVYKMTDNIREVIITCYITISTRQIQTSDIYCIK